MLQMVRFIAYAKYGDDGETQSTHRETLCHMDTMFEALPIQA